MDHWSLGVLLYAMLCGTVPFKAPSLKELHATVVKGRYTFPREVSSGTLLRPRLEARDLIGGLLRLAPAERLSLPEVLSHPWLAPEDDDTEANNYYVVKNEKAREAEESESDPSISAMNVDNLFFETRPEVRLGFRDYCYIANDFYTHHMGTARF